MPRPDQRYNQAILITRNNAWLVPRTCEIAAAFEDRGIAVKLIAFTGSTPGYIQGPKIPRALTAARRMNDQYFDEIFAPWVEEKARETFRDAPARYHDHLHEPRYMTLNQLAEKHDLHSAIRVDVGDRGREQYHAAVTSAIKPEEYNRTLAVSVDTRLIIGANTLRLIPHFGFHPGRMHAQQNQKKAVGDAASLKMVWGGNEHTLQAACHILGEDMDKGGVFDQFTLRIHPRQCMFEVRDNLYHGLTGGFETALPRILDPGIRISALRQTDAPCYREVDEAMLADHMNGWDGGLLPPPKLLSAGYFLKSLARILPPGTSVADIPQPEFFGLQKSDLQKISNDIGGQFIFLKRGFTYDGLGAS